MTEEGEELCVYFGHYDYSGVAASISSGGHIYLMDYADYKPKKYPLTGSVLSSGTSTMNFLQALGVIMDVTDLCLTDSSYVDNCELPLGIARIAVGRDTWYESLGFAVLNQRDIDFRNYLGRHLPSIDVLVETSKLMLNRNHKPGLEMRKAANHLVNRADLRVLIDMFSNMEYYKKNPGWDFLQKWGSEWGL